MQMRRNVDTESYATVHSNDMIEAQLKQDRQQSKYVYLRAGSGAPKLKSHWKTCRKEIKMLLLGAGGALQSDNSVRTSLIAILAARRKWKEVRYIEQPPILDRNLVYGQPG